MSEKRGLKGLEEWGRKVTDGYRDVKVENLTSCWRDGLAFCAIIHHFRPDLLDFNSLSKENVFHNNSLAFSVAEKQLGVPALLDAEDMVKCTQPDRLSIATYLSQLYQHFEGGANKKYGSSKAILKRPLGIKSLGIEPPSKIPGVGSGILPGRKYDICQSCKHRVFILERLVIDSKLYHRTCFKCFRCGALLKPGAYNEGETPGLYECTVCPRDEEGEFKTSKRNNSFKNDSEEKEPEQEAAHKSSNDVSKVEENLVLSQAFQQARRNFLQSDLNASDHLETKCAAQDPNDKISNLKTDNTIYGTNTPRLSQQTLNNTDNNQMHGKITEQPLHQHIETPHKTLVGKPPIAKKPDVLLISKCTRSGEESKLPDVIGKDSSISSICKKSLDGSDQRSIADLETNIATPQEGYKSLYTRQKLKPLKIELRDNHNFNIDAGKSLSPNSAQLDLPVIKSTNYHTPFVSKNLTRTKSESNFQQTQKLSMLSEALNILPRRNESVDDLEKVLHGKWSKQSNYLSMTKFQKKDFSSSRDLENIATKGDDEVSSSDPKLEEISIVKRETNETDSTLEESTKDLLSESIEIVTKIENKETNINRDLIIESPSVEVDVETSKSGKVEVNEAETVDSINEDSDKNLKDSSLDISLDKDVSSITDTHSTCTVNTEDSENREEEYPDDLNPFGDEESEDEDDAQNEDYPDSLNPFESSDDDEEDLSTFRKASTLPVTSNNVSNNVDKDEYDRSLNPFSSDEDDEDNVSEVHSSSKSLSIDSGCADSLISTSSPCGTRKKKKAPPPPPTVKEIFDKAPYKTKSYSHTLKPSPRSSQKRTAPKPPAAVPNDMSRRLNNITYEKNGMANEKTQKEKDNMNIMKSNQLYNSQNKQWRKKKRPAPSVPVPPRRQIKMIPLSEIQSEMAEIEVKQQELENQGRNLELLIRDYNQDSEPSMEEEEAIMQLFELVNQKNILFRRQAELMYIKRSQRLEEEQVELEFQIRCLMSKPASKKSENDNQREEELLQRLLDVVEQRNEIVDSIEMDRKSREVQEDQSIQEQTEQKFIEIKEKWSVTSKKKDKHKHKKDKKKKASKEESEASSKDHKQKKKKNWF